MGSSAFVWLLADARSTALTGAWLSPTTTAPACRGSMKTIAAPVGGPYLSPTTTVPACQGSMKTIVAPSAVL
jgi:hypothetical protein